MLELFDVSLLVLWHKHLEAIMIPLQLSDVLDEGALNAGPPVLLEIVFR